VVSTLKVLGYLLQISGMLIMFFAFFQLTSNFQGAFAEVLATMQSTDTVDNRPPCEPGQVSAECKKDFSSGNAIEDFFQPLMQQYIYLILLGLFLVFAGLILRSLEEMSAKWGRGPKMQVKERIRFGQEYM